MVIAFFMVCSIGLALLVVLPHSKNRMHRILTRGGAAAMFAVGLLGFVTKLFMS